MTGSLSHLLFPLNRDSFLKHYQAREHFHIMRASPGYYDNLLSVAELDAHLQSRQLPAASLNVVKEGVICPIEEWSRVETSARGAMRVASPESLLNLYSGGATLVVNQAQRTLPALNSTCRMLTQELGFPTHTNVYITPPNSVGFSRHRDEHEVLILQIAGSKYWLVYPPGASPVEVDLQSGDLLYIPRGMFHAARSRDQDSIHITLGLVPVYAFQLIEDLAALASKEDSFLQPLPPSFAGEAAAQVFETDFLARLRDLVAELRPSTLTDLHRNSRVADSEPGWQGRFSDLRVLHLMTADTVVCRRPGILTAVTEEGKFLNVQFEDQEVTIPVFLRDALRLVLGEHKFAVSEIAGLITSSGKVVLITEFVRAGLLQIVEI